MAWAVVLFVLSAIPDFGGLSRVPVSDKVVHAGLYFVLGAALAHGRSGSTAARSHLLLLGIGAVYAASDEWHQMFVPGRTPDPGDWLADVVGLVIGYGTTLRLSGRSERESKTTEGSGA